MLNTHLKSTYEGAALWVNKSQEEGQGAGFGFKGDVFFSGENIIAKLIKDTVVFSSVSYGMTTTKQRIDVERACWTNKKVFVPYAEKTLDENILEANAQIQSLLLRASTATVKRVSLVEEAKVIAKGMNEFGALLGETSEVIPMHQFSTLDFNTLKAQARAQQMQTLARSKKKSAKASKKITYRLGDPALVDVATHRSVPPIKIAADGTGIDLGGAFILLDGLHNMAGMGVSIQEDIHVSIQLPATISPDGSITVGGQGISFDKLQEVRGLLGLK